MSSSESLQMLLQDTPKDVADALFVLSAAVALTDEVAFRLIETCVPVVSSVGSFIDLLHLADFVVERNSEWHIQIDEREFLLQRLYESPELAEKAHAVLYVIAQETQDADPSLVGEIVPSYLTRPVGLAYHAALSDPEQALEKMKQVFEEEEKSEEEKD